MSEQDLIERLKSGDQATFKLFVESYKDKVFNTAVGILYDVEDANDIAQEVFVEVYRAVGRFKGQSKLSTWVYRITLNKCYEYIRKKNTQKRIVKMQPLFTHGSTNQRFDKPDFNHPGVSLENKEKASVLFIALGKLPANQRSAFVLHKLEDISYNEIALVMGLSLASVESLIFRAKQNLQKWLADYYDKNYK